MSILAQKQRPFDPIAAYKRMAWTWPDDRLQLELTRIDYEFELIDLGEFDTDDLIELDYQWEAFNSILEIRSRAGKHLPPITLGWPPEFLADIKHRIQIEDLIADSGVKLRAVGDGYRGRCPIHQGTSDNSLSVKPGNPGVWYCHGCLIGGDILNWLMFSQGIDFSSAVRWLAHISDTPIPERKRESSAEPMSIGFEYRGGKVRAA